MRCTMTRNASLVQREPGLSARDKAMSETVGTEASSHVPGQASVSTARILGTVYKDEDGNGTFDPGVDIPIPGAEVTAWLGGRLVATTRADDGGRYSVSVPAGPPCILRVSLPLGPECYDPRHKRWGTWSSVEGKRNAVLCPAENQDISVRYRMLNYGPRDFSWELWHEGPLFASGDVVLVHGFRFPGSSRTGVCDRQFKGLDTLLQKGEHRFNVWQFEYTNGLRGTPDTAATYAARLGEAVERIGGITGNQKCSIVAYSMGGIVARQYIASGGKSRVDKLLTLATPHMGTMQFEPFNLRESTRLVPRAALELRPDSKLLWDLNTDVEASCVPEFAAVGGHSRRHSDGVIELASAGLVKSNPDGSVAENLYFTGVNRSHLNINHIGGEDDTVFELVLSFLRGGVSAISRLRPARQPRDLGVRFFLTFTLKRMPRWRMAYPFVVVRNTGHRYWGFKVFSQGARTAKGAYIFTVPLHPDDDGEARIYYSPGKYGTVVVHRGQSTIASELIVDSSPARRPALPRAIWPRALAIARLAFRTPQYSYSRAER